MESADEIKRLPTSKTIARGNLGFHCASVRLLFLLEIFIDKQRKAVGPGNEAGLVLLHMVYLAHTMYCRTWRVCRTQCIGAHIEDSQKTYLATTDLLHAVLRHLNTKSLILRTACSELAQVVAVCPVDVPLGR